MATVLLVGDQPSVFMDLVALLEQEDFTILLANRDYEAIQLAQQYEPDTVVYDVTRTRANGKAFHLMLQVRPRTAHIPLVFLAHLDDWELPEVHYLEKPTVGSTMLRMIKHILNRTHKTVSQSLPAYSSVA